MMAPSKQMAQPSFPRVPSSSFKIYEPSTAPINTDNAPSGVTRMAGANAYAAKLQISPRTTGKLNLLAKGNMKASRLAVAYW